MNRTSTGIPNLDSLISGGFPFPAVILVQGQAGSGKSTFALQFIMEGARKGERGLYITTMSEKFNWMIRFMSNFSFFNSKYFESELVIYENLGKEVGEVEETKILRKINELIANYTPKRIVIDPINPLTKYIHDSRSFLFELVTSLKEWDCIAVLTGEVDGEDKDYSVVEYMADGIINLIMRNEGDVAKRYIHIKKMRGTEHSLSLHPLQITSTGIEVLKARF